MTPSKSALDAARERLEADYTDASLHRSDGLAEVDRLDLRLVLDALKETLDPIGVMMKKLDNLTPEQEEERKQRARAWLADLKRETQ